MLLCFDHSGFVRFGAFVAVGFGRSGASAALAAPTARAVLYSRDSNWLWWAAPVAMVVLTRGIAALGSAAICRHILKLI